MKRLIILFVPFLLLSCKEDDIVKPEFFICAEIDGSAVVFEHIYETSIGNRFDSEFHSLRFAMAVNEDGEGQRFDFFIRDLPLQDLSFPYSIPLTPVNSTSTQPFMFMSYQEKEEVRFAVGSTTLSNLALQITDFDDGIVTGLFSGTLPNIFNDELTRRISNGSFRVQIEIQ